MSILVTGGSGLLGRALVNRLSRKTKVLGVSKSGNLGTVACDLRKKEDGGKLFSQDNLDLVIHTAAYSDVDGCERDPALAHESNAVATKFLTEHCGSRKIPFIYVSTDYVFDGRKKTLYEENDPTCPVNIYGMTKLEGEYYARQTPQVSAVVRTSWLFGPGNPKNFVNAVLARLKNEKVVRVLDDQEDSPTYVEDLARAIETISDHLLSQVRKYPNANFHEIFQVCNTGHTTRYGLTLKIREFLGLKDVAVQKADVKSIQGRLAIRPAFAAMSTRHYENFFKTRLRRWEDALGEYLKALALCGS